MGRPFDGSAFNDTVSNLHQSLGRRTHNLRFAEIQKSGEGCRIILSQATIKAPCRSSGGRSKSVGEIDLKDIPRANVLDPPLNRLQEPFPTEIAEQLTAPFDLKRWRLQPLSTIPALRINVGQSIFRDRFFIESSTDL